MKKRLFVIDGHALCYRAYYALIRNPLINSDGQNVSAIFGFARMLYKLVQEQQPDYLAVAFDPPKRSFRFELYPEYKANRSKMPDDLKSQIEEIKHMVQKLDIPRLMHDEYEADDVLGTIAGKYASPELEVVLVTGDKDAYQLVNENVKILANTKGISEYSIYDSAGIEEKVGLTPSQIIDYMAIMGDSSDNIPGIKGIGEKGALKLIQAYGSLEGIYENLADLKGKQKEYVENNKDMAFLSRELVTIKTDVPLDFAFDDYKTPDLRSSAALDYFKELEMNAIIRDFFEEQTGENTAAKKEEKKDYRILRTRQEIEKMISVVEKAGILSIDTETTSTNAVDAELVGISFSIKEMEGWYLPLVSQGLFGSDEYLDPQESLALVKPLIENSAIKKIGHNIKYDSIVLGNYKINMGNIYFDTMVASYLLEPNERRHNLDDCAMKYLEYKTITFKELVGTGKKAIPIDEVPLEDLANYAVEDADITFRLYSIFEKQLKAEKLDTLFHELEMPLVSILGHIERTGVNIDADYFARIGKENERMLIEVQQGIYQDAEMEFNINSTRDLGHVLFERLKLPAKKKTKTGYSTDISVLESLQGSHPVIEKLISYRTLSKLKNTYIDTLPKLVSAKTGRIHTSYNQTVAATGRLSSSDPNLQNIPVKDEFGKKIRKGFVPEKGFSMLAADYSQIELRLAAHLSGDANMRTAFTEGIDIHSLTASNVFGVSIDQVEDFMRRQAKIINFATIYMVSPFGLSQQAEISMKDAALFIDKYFETYPGFKNYMEKTIAFAEEHGYVQTLMGRKRKIVEIHSDIKFRKEGAHRIAVNTPIQGTAADMIKVAMIDIHTDFIEKKLKSKMIMQVHDELVFEVADDEKDIVAEIVKEKMEGAMRLEVPVVVDMGWGANWEEAH